MGEGLSCINRRPLAGASSVLTGGAAAGVRQPPADRADGGKRWKVRWRKSGKETISREGGTVGYGSAMGGRVCAFHSSKIEWNGQLQLGQPWCGSTKAV
jgi:hypothetical protein